MSYSSSCIAKHSHNLARSVKVETHHGEFLTPTFMPVATKAAFNNLSIDDIKNTQSKIVLGGNTYHMLIAPGLKLIENCGGMHNFMQWHKPMLTDSGGFQVFSLCKNHENMINDHGVAFQHPRTQKSVILNAKKSIHAQKIIGADIIMGFDQCTKINATRNEAILAMQRTEKWLQESLNYHLAEPNSAYGYKQAFFGIIQGGTFTDLRDRCTEFVLSLNTDGIALGGAVIGFDIPMTCEIANHVCPQLPHNKVRYAMGVGLEPQNLIDVVASGIDIFDCVAPSRNARHGSLYCGKISYTKDNWLKFEPLEENGKILIKKKKYAQDESAIMNECDCHTCKNYSRAALHYYFKENFLLFSQLACLHNIRVMQLVCEKMRALILN